MEKLKTTTIKGKEYVTVNERIKYFRKTYPDHSLITKIIEVNDSHALIQAHVLDKEGHILATGTAYERVDEPGSMVNKTSHVENCETSAWGRALGNFGIGIDSSVASADEIHLSIKKQDALLSKSNSTVQNKNSFMPNHANAADITEIASLCKETKTNHAKLYEWAKVENAIPTQEQATMMLKALRKKLGKQIDESAKKIL